MGGKDEMFDIISVKAKLWRAQLVMTENAFSYLYDENSIDYSRGTILVPKISKTTKK